MLNAHYRTSLSTNLSSVIKRGWMITISCFAMSPRCTMFLSLVNAVCLLLLIPIVKSQDIEKSASPGIGVWNYIMGNGPKFCKCQCGKANNPSEAKIYHGQAIEAHQYPWLVLINLPEASSITATLLNDRYVITSASQLYGLTPYDVKVTLGEHNRCYSDLTSANFSVRSIILHPEYDPLSRSNDLALLRLSEAVINHRWIRSICLPQPGANYEDLVVSALGWGENSAFGDEPSETCRPRKVSLPVLDDRQCIARRTSSRISLRDKSCAGIVGTTPVICVSDAGGPVQYQAPDGFYEIVGVLSDANNCVENSLPTLYTRINEHFEWIFRNTKDGCFCSK